MEREGTYLWFSYIILYAVFGFVIGMHIGDIYRGYTISIFLCLICIFFLVRQKNLLFSIFVTFSFFLIGAFYSQSVDDYDLPFLKYRRDVKLVLQIQSISEKIDSNTVYGYAKIISGPNKLKPIFGRKVYFILEYDNFIPCFGQRISVSCKLERIKSDTKKPFLQFLFKNHIFLYCTNGNIEDAVTEVSKFGKFCLNYRRKFFSLLKSGLSDNKQIAILTGMLTGSKNKLDREQRSDFCNAGVAHIFAVSGLHIGLIALFFDWIFRIMLIPRKIRALPVLSILFIYLNIIGPMPSSVRAYLMIMFYYLALIIGRCPNVLSAFANSSVLHILYSPPIVYNISFLLSYCVVFGIIALGVPLNKMLRHVFERKQLLKPQALPYLQRIKLFFIKHFLENFCISLSASVVSVLMSIEFFGKFSWLIIVFNIFIVPLASISILLGSISLISGVLCLSSLCPFFNNLAVLPITLIELCFDITRKFHHGSVNIFLPVHEIWILSLVLIAVFGKFLAKFADHRANDINYIFFKISM